MNELLARYFGSMLAVILFTFLFSLPGSVCASEDVLRLLIWEGYAPEKYVEEFDWQSGSVEELLAR